LHHDRHAHTRDIYQMEIGLRQLHACPGQRIHIGRVHRRQTVQRGVIFETAVNLHNAVRQRAICGTERRAKIPQLADRAAALRPIGQNETAQFIVDSCISHAGHPIDAWRCPSAHGQMTPELRPR